MPLPKAKSNSFFSNSLFIFIIRFFPSLANLLVMIWYSRHLPQAAYGDYQHFWIQLSVIYPLACFGIQVLIITYSRELVLRLLQRISARSYTLYGAWLLVLSIVFALLQYRSVGIPVVIAGMFMLCFSVSVILESFLIVCRKYMALTIINIVYSIVFWLIHYYILQQAFSLSALFTWLLTITVVRLVVYVFMTIPALKHSEPDTNDEPDLAKTKTLWLHLGLFDVIQMLSNYMDKFVISILLTAQLSAIYFNGSQNIPFLPLLLNAASSAVLIVLAANNGQDSAGNLVHMMNRSGRMLACIVFPVFCYLFFFRSEFIIRVFTLQYAASVPVFAVAVLILPVRAYSFTTVLQKMHKGHIINTGAVAELLLACALMYPLYLWLGLPGVALSFVISTYLQAGYYLYHAGRALQVSPLQLIPYTDWLVKLIVFSTLFIGIHYVAGRYFTGNIPLILGGVMMAAAIMAALWIETKKQRTDVYTG